MDDTEYVMRLAFDWAAVAVVVIVLVGVVAKLLLFTVREVRRGQEKEHDES